MSVSLKLSTANVLFDIRLRADHETGDFVGHPYYVHKLAVLERLGCIEHVGPDRWRLTNFGRTCTVTMPENFGPGRPRPAVDG